MKLVIKFWPSLFLCKKSFIDSASWRLNIYKYYYYYYFYY